MITIINTIADVKLFTLQLVEEGTNVHPDEDFHNYVHITTGQPAYTYIEAEIRNQLMERSFVICKENSIDIYDLMQEIFLIETGLYKYIPLPHESGNSDIQNLI